MILFVSAIDDVAVGLKEGFQGLTLLYTSSEREGKNPNDIQTEPKRFGVSQLQYELLLSSSFRGKMGQNLGQQSPV